MSPIFATDTSDTSDEWFLPADVRTQLSDTFKRLQKQVTLEVFTKPGLNDEFSDFTVKFCTDLARLSPLIAVKGFEIPSGRADELGITAAPTLCINPDEYHIRFMGAPSGEEGKSFITAIMLASLGRSNLSEISRQVLEELNEERLAQIFVSPT